MDTRGAFLCLLVVFANFVNESSTTSDDVDQGKYNRSSERSLSRKKRYLIFPQGSSLQLIFCWVVPIIGMPNIFTMGLTAAVAWELPTKPEDVLRKKLPDHSDTRRVDKPVQIPIQTTPSPKWNPRPYVKYNKIYNDPFYAKGPHRNPTYYATMWGSPTFRNALRRKYGMKWSPSSRGGYGRIDDDEYYYRNPVYQEVHKRTRRDFYEKIEKVLFSKQVDGKACILKIICKISNAATDEVGTFWEEILKTVFRVRTYHHRMEKDEYDLAGQTKTNCTEMYSTCSLF